MAESDPFITGRDPEISTGSLDEALKTVQYILADNPHARFYDKDGTPCTDGLVRSVSFPADDGYLGVMERRDDCRQPNYIVSDTRYGTATHWLLSPRTQEVWLQTAELPGAGAMPVDEGYAFLCTELPQHYHNAAANGGLIYPRQYLAKRFRQLATQAAARLRFPYR